MELRCPHCGKKQSLSVATLTASGGVVICPQCVSEFPVDLATLREESAPKPEPTVGADFAQDADIAFCPTCGKRLPAKGLNFCPYCGAPLPFANAAPSPASPQYGGTASVDTQKNTASAPGEPEEKTLEQKLASLPFMKAPGFIAHQHEPASWRFSIVAWLVIVLLVALFALMVWHGNIE